jgi:hypothetical protein
MPIDVLTTSNNAVCHVVNALFKSQYVSDTTTTRLYHLEDRSYMHASFGW